jgi:DNA-binding SARP family transcriptional activator
MNMQADAGVMPSCPVGALTRGGVAGMAGIAPPLVQVGSGLAADASVRLVPDDVSVDSGSVLCVRMLAGFQVWLGTDPVVDLPRGKSRSLLKLLLLHRLRPLSRARLCALFWPEVDAASARNCLNVTLHRLRRSLGHSVTVRHSEEGYQLLAANGVWLDTEQFLLHADIGDEQDSQHQVASALNHYEAALALYRSDLVDDEEHGPALATDAQSLRDRLNQVVQRLAELREQCADWHGCLRAAQRHLTLDQCNEAAHRRLMRCYAQLGQIQLAERQYRNCVAVLRTQLALSPSDETTRQYRCLVARTPA